MNFTDINISRIVITTGVRGCDRNRLKIAREIFIRIFNRTPKESLSRSNIREFGTAPNRPLGYILTFRNNPTELLRVLLNVVNNRLPQTSVGIENTVSFGIPSHLSFPNQKVTLDEGIIGFNVNIVFQRPGRRIVERMRNPVRRLPNRIRVTRPQIREYLQNIGVQFY